jgi:hypothetical protein
MSGVASGDGETSVGTEVVEAVAAETVVPPMEEVGVGDESFLAKDFFSFARLFWNHTFSWHEMRSDIPVSRRGGKGKEKWRKRRIEDEGKKERRGKERERDGRDTYLNLPRWHLEFFGEFFALWRVRFLVSDKDALQYLELSRGGTLASLDGVGNICIEHFGVDLCRIHAGWNERGDIMAMGRS